MGRRGEAPHKNPNDAALTAVRKAFLFHISFPKPRKTLVFRKLIWYTPNCLFDGRVDSAGTLSFLFWKKEGFIERVDIASLFSSASPG